MNKIQTPPVKYDTFKLQGGLDLVTPTLSLPPGVARDSLNFEVNVTGGYSRVAGYEGYSGKFSYSLSKAADTTQIVTVTTVLSSATYLQTPLKNLSGSATGLLVKINSTELTFVNRTGTFSVGETLYELIGSSTGAVITAVRTATDAADEAAIWKQGFDAINSLLNATVPGTGPVLGVAQINGSVYAWREQTSPAGTVKIFKGSPGSNWISVPLGSTLNFTGGTGTAIAEGNTVTGASSGATGVVSRVVVRNGTTWAGATGTLILSSTTGTFTASENLQVGGTTRAVASGAAAAITLSAGAGFRVQTVKANLSGAAGATRLYGCDNVNPGFEFDGTVYVPITTGMANDKPNNVAAHKNHLFFSFGSSLQHSGVGTPYVWSPVYGAAELAMPEGITALESLPGDATTGTLAVFGRENTFMLYGTGVANWNLVSFDRGVGAAPYTVKTLTDAYALDDKGVVALSTSRNFGGFDVSTLTFPIRPFIQATRNLALASGVNRERSQYRVFYSNNYALFCTIVNGKMMGAMPVQFRTSMNCWCEGETANGEEVNFCGGVDGKVYRMDTGRGFDGNGVDFNLALTFNAEGSSRVLKRYRKVSLEIDGSAYSKFDFSYQLGYASTQIDQSGSTTYETPFATSTVIWDGQSLAPTDVLCDGTAENISLKFTSSGASGGYAPFTINSVTLHYTPRRGIR